jgi:beta-glucanase (GH16 family)
VTDSGASGGKALAFYTDVSRTGSLTARMPAPLLNVRVRADQCNGSPSLAIVVDGWERLRTPISSGEWQTFSTSAVKQAGVHQVRLQALNDLWIPGQCDRNIYVDRVWFSWPQSNTTTTTRPATTTTLAPSTTTTTVAAPVTTSTTTRANGPLGPSGSWRLAYGDDFNGTALDATKWTDCYQWSVGGCTTASNHELQWYRPENISVANGAMRLTAKREAVVGRDGITYPYSSGMASTGADLNRGVPAKFTFMYGYAETRVLLPRGTGLWPSMWLLPADGSWPPELDVFENLGNDMKTIHLTTHWGTPGNHQQSGGTFTGPDFAAGWHTIGLDWQPDSLTWYVDGVAVRTYTSAAGIPSKPMYLLVNLAVGGDWPGSPDASTAFPAVYQLDYVRVWQRN